MTTELDRCRRYTSWVDRNGFTEEGARGRANRRRTGLWALAEGTLVPSQVQGVVTELDPDGSTCALRPRARGEGSRTGGRYGRKPGPGEDRGDRAASRLITPRVPFTVLLWYTVLEYLCRRRAG